MKKKIVYPFLFGSLLLLGACSEQALEKTEPQTEEVAHVIEEEETGLAATAQWAYEADVGPDYWGELDNSFAACVNGTEQSPINIESSQVKSSDNLEGVEVQYEPTQFSIINTGHTVQANPATDNNTITVDGKEYTLAQFHFHTPSEHQINSKYFDMELHLVHQDENGELAVLGVMIQEGEENEALASTWEVLPENETVNDVDVEEAIDLQALLPSNQTTFHYNGSLTTPPCAEKVNWTVFEEPIEMSKEQIQAYQEMFPGNQRPVQPLNEREVFGLN